MKQFHNALKYNEFQGKSDAEAVITNGVATIAVATVLAFTPVGWGVTSTIGISILVGTISYWGTEQAYEGFGGK